MQVAGNQSQNFYVHVYVCTPLDEQILCVQTQEENVRNAHPNSSNLLLSHSRLFYVILLSLHACLMFISL